MMTLLYEIQYISDEYVWYVLYTENRQINKPKNRWNEKWRVGTRKAERVSEWERKREGESFLRGLLGIVLLVNGSKHWSVGTSERWKFSEEKNRVSILDQCNNQVRYIHRAADRWGEKQSQAQMQNCEKLDKTWEELPHP